MWKPEHESWSFMADWVAHLAIAAGGGKCLRLKNLHVILLGALIPDIPGVVGVLSDKCWLTIDAYRIILGLLPLTSILAAACMCLAMALWLSHPWRAFWLLLMGPVLRQSRDSRQAD